MLPNAVQDQLPEELVEKVKWQVNRESAESKVRDFLDWMKAIKGIVNHLVSSASYFSLFVKQIVLKRGELVRLVSESLLFLAQNTLKGRWYTRMFLYKRWVQCNLSVTIKVVTIVSFCNIVVHHILPCNVLSAPFICTRHLLLFQ